MISGTFSIFNNQFMNHDHFYVNVLEESSCTLGGLSINRITNYDHVEEMLTTHTSVIAASSSVTLPADNQYFGLILGEFDFKDIKIRPGDTCLVETGIPPDQYLPDETLDIDTGSYSIYFPTKIACPNNIILTVD